MNYHNKSAGGRAQFRIDILLIIYELRLPRYAATITLLYCRYECLRSSNSAHKVLPDHFSNSLPLSLPRARAFTRYWFIIIVFHYILRIINNDNHNLRLYCCTLFPFGSLGFPFSLTSLHFTFFFLYLSDGTLKEICRAGIFIVFFCESNCCTLRASIRRFPRGCEFGYNFYRIRIYCTPSDLLYFCGTLFCGYNLKCEVLFIPFCLSVVIESIAEMWFWMKCDKVGPKICMYFNWNKLKPICIKSAKTHTFRTRFGLSTEILYSLKFDTLLLPPPSPIRCNPVPLENHFMIITSTATARDSLQNINKKWNK